MPAPAHNGYPVQQEAFQNEVAMQFADGQMASAFAAEGDVIAWGQHPLANLDPGDPNGTAEAIIKTNEGTLYLKNGEITDVTASEQSDRHLTLRAAGGQLPDIQIGGSWQCRFGAPVMVERVLLRDGNTGAPQDQSRRQSAQPNPFDIIAGKLAAIDRREQSRQQRSARIAPMIGRVATSSGAPQPNPLAHSVGRVGRPPMRPYYRAAGR